MLFRPEGQLWFVWVTIFPISAGPWAAPGALSITPSVSVPACPPWAHPGANACVVQCQGNYTRQVFSQSLAWYFVWHWWSCNWAWAKARSLPMGNGRMHFFRGDGGVCKLRHFLCSAVSRGSADPGTATQWGWPLRSVPLLRTAQLSNGLTGWTSDIFSSFKGHSLLRNESSASRKIGTFIKMHMRPSSGSSQVIRHSFHTVTSVIYSPWISSNIGRLAPVSLNWQQAL